MRFLRHTLYYRLFRRVLPSVAVTVLRKRHFAFLVLAGQASSSESEQCDKSVKSGKQIGPNTTTMQREQSTTSLQIDINEKLLLYYDHFSYYSQKVVMALHEKNLQFESKIVNLLKNEQYESWFLKLNSKGEVPVLQDAIRIIPDSGRIIDYLEDNFSNGDTPRLIPMIQGPEVRQKVNHFRHLLQQAPEGELTTGSVLNPGMLKNARVPFIGPVRKALAAAEKNGADKLRELAEKNPEAKSELLRKAAKKEQLYTFLLLESNFKEVLDKIESILIPIEEELSQHTGDKENWWLCSDLFTIADVELTILLERISQLGLEYRFWSNGKRPHIEKYYERVKKRDSYKKTIPSTFFFIKTLLISQAPIVVGIVAAVAIIVSGAIIAKKYI